MMRRFDLIRSIDKTGVSGTGIVAEGVEFSDGKVALTWLVSNFPKSYAIYDSIYAVDKIHGHNGDTKIEWIDW